MATTIVITAIDGHATPHAFLGLYASHILNYNRVRYIDKASRLYGVLACVHLGMNCFEMHDRSQRTQNFSHWCAFSHVLPTPSAD
jgi:hypothetical protein